MSEKLYETIEISDLKDMLNKTKKIHPCLTLKQERILHFYFFISSVSIINRTLPLCPS